MNILAIWFQKMEKKASSAQRISRFVRRGRTDADVEPLLSLDGA